MLGLWKHIASKSYWKCKTPPSFLSQRADRLLWRNIFAQVREKNIRERFYNSEHFVISYPVTIACNNTACVLRNERCEERNLAHDIDLKEIYDTCEEEVSINGFVADLLLTSSKKPNIPPILIEICVSHACEVEKRNSGLKIIEIKIKDESDFDKIFSDGVLKEIVPSWEVKVSNVEFISFKRIFSEQRTVKISRYIFNPQSVAEGYFTQTDCSDANYRIRKNSILELNVVDDNPYYNHEMISALLWLYRNKGIRRCNICKFYYATMYEEYPICRLSKKYGKPKYPKANYAEQCSSFFMNENMMSVGDGFHCYEEPSNYKEGKDEYKVIIAGSSDFHDKSLFKQKVDSILSGKIFTHNIIILAGTSTFTKEMIWEYAEANSIHVEQHQAKWGKYYERGSMDSLDDMVNEADAVIAFWNGKGTITGELIGKAQIKGLPCRVIRY